MTNSKAPRGLAFLFTAIATIAMFVTVMPATAAEVKPPQPIADAKASQSHLFSYQPFAGQNPASVSVAGDFNGWSSTANPLTKNGNRFELNLPLSEGVHFYKFVVDGQWLNDPASVTELEVPDNYGGKNSALLIGLDARKLPNPVADQINAAAVAFDASDVRDCNVVSDQLLRLSIRTQASDVSSVSIVTQTKGAWIEAPLTRLETSMGFDRFGGLVSTPTLPDAKLHYYFKLSKPGATAYVADSKLVSDATIAQSTSYAAEMRASFQTPDWAKHAVWYQIFPERFRNGDTSNDPELTLPWTGKWFDKQPGETGDFYGKDVWARRYGGDIQGIRQQLPYLRSLGITAIYLNPIFQAFDMHKYDTTDYRHVDEHFGKKGDIEALVGETDDPATWQWTASDKIFLDFVAEAHRQGFKVIIDGVFNHTGTRFWAFQDVVKNGKNSKYADWFDITDWNDPGIPGENAPFHYHAWDKDNGSLPALKKDPVLGIAHGPREHIMAITKRWLAPDGDASKGVDGFRLDAPEGIAHPFWAEWRKLVKTTKPDAYITGEIWSWAQSYLKGDEYDAVMNYQFAMPSQEFFVNQKKAISITELNNRANQLIFNYPFQVALVNQNLFDSHDTDRVASMFVNPDLAYDSANRIQDNGPKYSSAKPNAQQRLRMLQEVAWQMTFVGAPMIYYGDENGMWGPDDPSDRQPMVWKDLLPYQDPQVSFDQEKFDWYQRLIAVRSHLPALQLGFYRPVKIDDAKGIFVYARDLGDQHVYVAINHTDRAQSVTFSTSEQNADLVNWLDPTQSKVISVETTNVNNQQSANRPDVTLAANAKLLHAQEGNATISLPAWGSAIVTSTNPR